MSRRFTSTEKWDKEWFQDLSPKLKCLWQYLTDRCDHAGLWDVNFKMASFCIGEKVTKDDLRAFEGKVKWIASDKLYLTGFVDFQYGVEGLSETSKPHQSVIKILKRNNLPVKLKKVDTLSKPLPKGSVRIKDKDKDKDKDKVKNKDKKSKRASRLPDDWKPSDSHRQYCDANGIDFDTAVKEFKGWAANTPQKYLDWGMTFHNALKDWLPERLPATKSADYGPSGLIKEVIRP
tara:strand:+ start:3059 stop:3760 length:702 start_codon:yes stop_codon:yes gene_type:complete